MPIVISEQIDPVAMLILKAMTPVINEIKKCVNNMIPSGMDYRVSTKFRKEIKQDIEFRNVRRIPWMILTTQTFHHTNHRVPNKCSNTHTVHPITTCQ